MLDVQVGGYVSKGYCKIFSLPVGTTSECLLTEAWTIQYAIQIIDLCLTCNSDLEQCSLMHLPGILQLTVSLTDKYLPPAFHSF